MVGADCSAYFFIIFAGASFEPLPTFSEDVCIYKLCVSDHCRSWTARSVLLDFFLSTSSIVDATSASSSSLIFWSDPIHLWPFFASNAFLKINVHPGENSAWIKYMIESKGRCLYSQVDPAKNSSSDPPIISPNDKMAGINRKICA